MGSLFQFGGVILKHTEQRHDLPIGTQLNLALGADLSQRSVAMHQPAGERPPQPGVDRALDDAANTRALVGVIHLDGEIKIRGDLPRLIAMDAKHLIRPEQVVCHQVESPMPDASQSLGSLKHATFCLVIHGNLRRPRTATDAISFISRVSASAASA